MTFVKYYPVLMRDIMLASIFDELIIIASIVLRFKTGCFENERNSDRDAA